MYYVTLVIAIHPQRQESIMSDEPLEENVEIKVLLTSERADALDAAGHVCSLKTRKDIFDYAMTIFHWAVTESLKGREIASFDPEKREIEILRTHALDSARRNGKQGYIGN